MIARFHLSNATPCRIPLDPNIKFTESDLPKADDPLNASRKSAFLEIVGSLMYAAVCTRPDITFAVTFLSQFSMNPGEKHLTAALNVVRYLRGSRTLGITYGINKQLQPVGYSDSDWARQEHRHSTSGFVFTLNGGAISWSSKKQPIIALSSTEAEYIALTHAAKEAIWYRHLFHSIHLPLHHPITLYCDNIALRSD